MLELLESPPVTPKRLHVEGRVAQRLLVATYALTTLLGALLLFEVQPIISKFILPWFGGSPAVWTTAMVFFQTLLFAGYAYAHVTTQYLRPRWQAALHVLLLVAAVAMLPIAPSASWKLPADSSPTWHILCLLAISVGLPYFALSTTGPLVQAWFCRSLKGRSPYRLYALSNFGSLVALLGYPFFVEPRLDVGRQAWLWGAGFVGFAILCAAGAVMAAMAAGRRADDDSDEETPNHAAATVATPTWHDRLFWLGLPALASVMLLATTNHICQDVAVIPFLWVAPLALYLLSFIITFDHASWYRRRPFAMAGMLSLTSLIVVDQLITGGSGLVFHFWQELALHLAALFFLCMLCHGELFRRRPDPRFLTSYYLMISAGGALGGMFVSLLAPHLFTTFFEWRIALVVGLLMSAWVWLEKTQSFFRRRFGYVATVALTLFVGLSCAPGLGGGSEPASARNFFGVVSVVERNVDDPAQHRRDFYSGRIVHGLQFSDADKRHEPTAYYGRAAGVGQAMAQLADRPNLRIGAVGLGVGTIAAYARPGDTLRFYEINPEVIRIARDYFRFLSDCQGDAQVVLGDARLSLENEQPQNFDLLVLDAFSGDAVPAHLLTREAFEVYRRHLKPDGMIAVHISNRYLDLEPVLAGLAEHFGYALQRIDSPAFPEFGQFPADWILLTPGGEENAKAARSILWTDGASNLFEILR